MKSTGVGGALILNSFASNILQIGMRIIMRIMISHSGVFMRNSKEDIHSVRYIHSRIDLIRCRPYCLIDNHETARS